MKQTYKAKLIKENQPPRYKFNVISVKANKKYGYFEITTKIYHHEFIETLSFKECDKIELYIEGNKIPCTTIEKGF